jgi:murein L,D-transpeptidase YafK
MAIRPVPSGAARALALMSLVLLVLAGCNSTEFAKADKPVPYVLQAKMQQLSMKQTAPIFIRIFKQESEMEIWKQQADGRYGLLKTYPICKWSGDLGPKKEEGDRQAPEGFYTVTPAQMNPDSNYYLSFNIGYPNAYDRSLGRTGTNLMVHGACSSAGCYSMTDESAGEIFALARDAFRGGQRAFQIQAFPFRMTPENLAKHADDPNMDFWRMLKIGYDSFELTHVPPKVDVCDRHYVFNADAGDATFNPSGACPAYTVPQQLADALQRKQAQDDAAFAKDVAMLGKQQQTAAYQAAHPSFIQRLIDGKQPVAAAPPQQPATAPATPVVPPKPQVSTAPPPTPKPSPALAANAPAADSASAAVNATIAPGATPEIQPVGKFVKKKFLWPGDTAPTTGTSGG